MDFPYLAAAMVVSLLSVSAFAAERTIYLSGYGDTYSVVEVPEDESELCITGDLEDYGKVTLSDLSYDDAPIPPRCTTPTAR